MKEINDYITSLRKDYASRELRQDHVHPSPFYQFKKWMQDTINSNLPEANAMTLATASKDCRPTARIVLLRSFNESGFSFFTNYHSRKGQELISNPQAALNFFWSEIERQVRIEGTIKKLSEKESDEYFKTRPRESQLGAWASEQSKTLQDREELESQVIEFTEKFKDIAVPRPPHWGGFCLKPDYFEFWQGRANRLHDRIAYQLEDNGNWTIKRLAP
jgi:pyridoxamine 5'-phosphate oxidase